MRQVPGPARHEAAGQTARERLDRYRDPHGDLGGFMIGALLAIAVFLLTLTVSCRQATDEARARNVLEAGIATLTDIDQLIADDRDDLEQLAEATDGRTVAIPGYPLDVQLTTDEVANLSDAELRDVILARSSQLVYDRGVDAFDRTGNQSLSTFSAQGMLERLVGQVSSTTHERAGLASVVLAIIAAVLGLFLVLRSEGFRKVRNPGIAILVGGGAVFLLALFVRFMGNRVGGSDPFVDRLRDIAETLIEVPMRNGLIVALFGAFVAVLGPFLSVLSERVPAFQPAHAHEGWDDYGYEDDFDDDFRD
ncbi:MAG: hypothetical protein ACM3S1_11820 [Hyphomicrobiales bacterium]